MWEQAGVFRPEPAEGRDPFVIMIPPPNVTGSLTMGHVLGESLRDLVVRWQRMEGRETLWVPGTDHAGIATQNAVEKMLRQSGKSRHDLGREAFLAEVWKWKDTYGGLILKQLRSLGISADWTRERFTLDPAYSRAVLLVFQRLYEKGLIYRGHRIVNWCPRCQTALSDEEVDHVERDGSLWHIKYPLKDSDKFLTVATTRPETMLGDTGIAVNPKDRRYAHLVGKQAVLPIVRREIPIVADPHVDPKFGTGALKITPAHDPNDFELAQRHGLAPVIVMDERGVMNERAGDFRGLDRFEARERIVAALQDSGYLEKVEPHRHAVGTCQRCGTIVEPYLSLQWFVRMAPLAAPAIEAAKKGKVKFYPARWRKVYLHWMENIRDWCISRQLWWGHRIPVWYRGEERVVSVDPPEGEGWTQDEDVLDTWFSSGLWPFSTLGWPEKTRALSTFYPNNVLVTGPDIIFFWVARMIMAGYEWMGDLPFRNVYFTGIIRDKQGRKMSKSLGNSPDPLDLIAKYGADALRFGVMRAAPLGQDVLFDEQSVELGRNFCNKLWNACRFRQMQGGATEGEINPALLSSDDRWILLRLDQAIREVTQAFADYKFSDATATLYRFFWSEYCDWYIEASKAAFHGTDEALKANKLAVIDFVIGHLLRLFHPFLPFITEELWHGMGFNTDLPENQGGRTLLYAPWPKPLSDDEKTYFGLDDSADQVAQAKYDLVTLGRSLRRDCKIDPARKVKFVLRPSGELADDEADVLKLLLNAESLVIESRFAPPKGTPMAANALGELFLPLEGLVDVAAERTRLTKELEKIRSEIGKVEAKLANPAFTQKVPASVLTEHQQRLLDWQSKERQVRAGLDNLPE